MTSKGTSVDIATDEAVLSAIRNGDPDAWKQVSDAFRRRLRHLAAASLPPEIVSRLDASDIVQQTFAEADAAYATFVGRSLPELFAWMAAILKHNVSDAVRQHLLAQNRTVNAECRLQDSSTSSPTWQAAHAADQTSPSVAVTRTETFNRLLRAIETLPPRQREAVRLRHLEGLPLVEIAAKLSCSVLGAAALISRGLRALRQELRDVA